MVKKARAPSPSGSAAPSSSSKRTKTGGRLSADHCKCCLRKWDSDNPIVRQRAKCPHLPRTRGYGAVCDVCIRAHKQSGEKKALSDIVKGFEEDETGEKRLTYMKTTLKMYENKRNGFDPLDGIDQENLPESASGPQVITSLNKEEAVMVSGLGDCGPQLAG